jgi:hypothetical protein
VFLLGATLTGHGAIVTHRYSFNGDPTDSIGDADATLIGNATITGGQLVLPGGPPRSNYASLPLEVGAGINSSTALTIEIWFTQNVAQNWSKAFYFGNNAGGSADDGLELCLLKGDGTGVSKVEFLNDRVANAFGGNGRGSLPFFDIGHTPLCRRRIRYRQ